MPRKGSAGKRSVDPDPIYQNQLVTQLINKILLSGKKSVAERMVYRALETISERTANDPVITLKRAVENARPLLEVRSRRGGGATYQVPVGEIMDAASGQGSSVKRKEDMHKMAEANKAFAHYRW